MDFVIRVLIPISLILLAVTHASLAWGETKRLSAVSTTGPLLKMEQVDGAFLILRGEPGDLEIVVIDTTDPARPSITRKIPVQVGAVDFLASTQNLFLMSNEPGATVRVFDRKTGREVGRYEPPGGGTAIGIATGQLPGTLILDVEGHTGSHSELILDVRLPETPKLLTTRDVTPPLPGSEFDPAGTLSQLASSFAGASRVVGMERSTKDPGITVLALDGEKSEVVLVRDLEHQLEVVDASNGDGSLELACLGDSNTTNNIARSPVSWCALVADSIWQPHLEVRNYSSLGASLQQGIVPGTEQWEKAIASGADVLILAFGTNDLRAGHRPEKIVAEYKKFSSKARELGVQMYVATTPPIYQKDHPGFGQVDRLNQLIQKSFPSEQVLDFHSGFGPEYFLDGIHVTPEGHQLRGERVANRLLDRKAP